MDKQLHEINSLVDTMEEEVCEQNEIDIYAQFCSVIKDDICFLLYSQSSHLQEGCNISILLVCLLFKKLVINQVI